MNIIRWTFVVTVLCLTVFSSFAIGEESWAVVAYIESNNSMENQVFKEMSEKTENIAIAIATDTCITYGESRKAKNSCKLIGACSKVGWFAIASMVKTSGHVGIGCGKATEQEAIGEAKKICGSGGCAKVFTRDIKQPEKKKRHRNGG